MINEFLISFKQFFIQNNLIFKDDIVLIVAEQVNNIRETATLANMLCKTAKLESIQANPMFIPSYSNPKISCPHIP